MYFYIPSEILKKIPLMIQKRIPGILLAAKDTTDTVVDYVYVY